MYLLTYTKGTYLNFDGYQNEELKMDKKTLTLFIEDWNREAAFNNLALTLKLHQYGIPAKELSKHTKIMGGFSCMTPYGSLENISGVLYLNETIQN